MLKRIWAVVSDNDFYALQQRAKQNGMDMGQALAAIVHTYAIGEDVTVNSVHTHKGHLDYLKEVEDESHKQPHLKDIEG